MWIAHDPEEQTHVYGSHDIQPGSVGDKHRSHCSAIPRHGFTSRLKCVLLHEDEKGAAEKGSYLRKGNH